jgi:general secretion pathway protein L
MASHILSIDLQSDLLTAVLLEDDINKNIIASAAIITAEKTAEELITELTATLDCRNCRCFLSLGASFFSFRNIDLPFSDRKSINKVLPFELDESTASPIDTMLIDAMVTINDEGNSEILTAMIQREALGEYHTALKDAGITLEIITLSGLATIAAIQANGKAPEEFIFLDLRLDNAALFLITSGKLQLVRSLSFTPLPNDTGPKTEFAVDEESGELQVQGLEHSAESFLKLALTVKQTLAPLPMVIAQEKMPIYLDGTTGSTGKVASWLEAPSAFNKPCLICGRSGLLPPPIGLPKATEAHASFLTACLSLGMQGDIIKRKNFNFCKEEFTFQGDLAEYRTMGRIVGLSLLALLILGLGYLWYDTGSLKQERAALVTDIHGVFKETLPKVTRIVDPVQQLHVAINELKTSSNKGGNTNLPYSALHILREISTRIPPSIDVRLTRLVYESKGLRLIGLTDSFNTVNSMQKSLEQSPDFKSVIISSTKQIPKDNKIRFELKVELGAPTT